MLMSRRRMMKFNDMPPAAFVQALPCRVVHTCTRSGVVIIGVLERVVNVFASWDIHASDNLIIGGRAALNIYTTAPV
jgi:hypothetical protein